MVELTQEQEQEIQRIQRIQAQKALKTLLLEKTEANTTLGIDEIHASLESSPLTKDIINSKYSNDDLSWEGLAARVVSGIYYKDPKHSEAIEAFRMIVNRVWVPAGRILAGAGTSKRVTLNNCYVTGTIDDDLPSIMRELTNFALTMQQGGGDGADFSTIRPAGARLTRTGTAASGPLPFMDMWNAMCTTIRSSGDRRGAMMGVLSDTHPDLPAFITAKRTKGVLTNFNISVLVSDAFMEAVQDDEDWPLYFAVEPVTRDPALQPYDFEDENGVMQYVYSVWKARALYDLIIENTYNYAEPGIIFIDRINEDNNLWYCEDIRATNPCGEQPLPPHGACTLGHINLAVLVRNPFTSKAEINWDVLSRCVRMGVRFLDNVIDVTNYPLSEQETEQKKKRRIGLGFTGLADAFVQLGIRYGSHESLRLQRTLGEFICTEAYLASCQLAEERGSFPEFDVRKYLSSDAQSFVSRLPAAIRTRIRKSGIRNGVLLTVAPTGTTSIAYNNVSAGLEPIFAVETTRKVLQPDNTFKEYTDYTYSARLWKAMHGNTPYPTTMVTTDDLSVQDHINMQAAVQLWVDASVSKTINVPEDISFEAFKAVYELAYKQGCKGCTTYRPSDVRGSILTNANSDANVIADFDSNTQSSKTEISSPENMGLGKLDIIPLRKRPEILHGKTIQIKWPNREAAYYLTLNYTDSGELFEMLIQSKDGTNAEWTTALSLMITAIFRRGGDVSFVPYELKQIQSLEGGIWYNQGYVGSLPALIGKHIEEHMNIVKENQVTTVSAVEEAEQEMLLAKISSTTPDSKKLGRICPVCSAPSVFKAEGCDKCMSCTYSKCG